MRRVILLAVLIAGSSTAAFAGGVPERVWDALDSRQEEYEFEGETYNALEVITEAANRGVVFSEPARVRPHRFERTPYEYMIERTLSFYAETDEEFARHFEHRLPVFVERFVRMYMLLPDDKRDYIHSEDLREELLEADGPNVNFVRYLADKDSAQAITPSDAALIRTLRDDPRVIDAILESWGVPENPVEGERYEVRAIAAALGLTDLSLAEVVEQEGADSPSAIRVAMASDLTLSEVIDAAGISSEVALSRASAELDSWLRRSAKDSEPINDFILAWLEQTDYGDVPWMEDGKLTTTFLGRTFSEMRPEHMTHLIDLGLRQDGEALHEAFDFHTEYESAQKPAHLSNWLRRMGRNGRYPRSENEVADARAVVELLIREDFDLDDGYLRPGSEWNSLHTAALIGDVGIVRMLVEAGIDPRHLNATGDYPLDIAKVARHVEVAEYLEPLTYGGEVRVVEREVPAESTDENPPRIRLNPLDRERGLAVAEEDRYDGRTTLSSIAIGGIVVDEGNIERVAVGEAETTFNNLGEFEHRVPLQIGENRIAVVAEDEAGNRATATIVVLREEARTLADELGIAGTYYALIIGNEAYADMPELLTPHEDANRLSQILSDTYGFETEVLLDASRADILDAINRYARLLEPEDRFILYYAGHGYFDETADLAYWLPVDASTETDTNWILSNRITGSLRRMEAQHVAVIADSCYSGTLTRDASIDLTSGDRTTTEYLRRMVERPSRTLLASGGNEPVADGGGGNHSVFAGYLLNALESTDQEVFSLEDLFHNEIRVQVTGNSLQTPEYNTIRNSGHEGGDFVFVRE